MPRGLLLGLLLAGIGEVWAQETDSLFLENHPDMAVVSFAQIQRKPAEAFMKSRIHFMSDFFMKFNDTTALDENPAARHLRILELMDALVLASKAPLVQQCLETLGKQPIQPTQEGLFAEVSLQIRWQQEVRKVKLYLKKQQQAGNWSWQLLDVDTEWPPSSGTLMPATDSLVFIPPNAHELNFMGLSRIMRADVNFGSCIHPDPSPRLTALVRAIANQEAQVLLSLDSQLWWPIHQGWWLKIQSFSRETEPSGWLISDLGQRPQDLPPALRAFWKPE
ncbi:hypothetical protein BWI97_21820 [Siphonobacter sp. BAB-5405]|uniref:hypothetical protein n=1 Tax=Siphonobacter sp. BAB-5405 TaxID=1864825 RepID=UPI000C7FC0FD|nr:hypothetical protein [Siphonobacter sp. BAB-5405]PMD91462.1 hypothetical protein BWI97_21820 [Siphonobacter sp. BAB-5405]